MDTHTFYEQYIFTCNLLIIMWRHCGRINHLFIYLFTYNHELILIAPHVHTYGRFVADRSSINQQSLWSKLKPL